MTRKPSRVSGTGYHHHIANPYAALRLLKKTPPQID